MKYIKHPKTLTVSDAFLVFSYCEYLHHFALAHTSQYFVTEPHENMTVFIFFTISRDTGGELVQYGI